MQRTSTLLSVLLSSFTLCVAESASAQVPEGYYDSADASTPQALRESLHEIIDDHLIFPYTSFSTDTWDILEMADEDPDNSGRIITIYRNASFAKQGGGNAFYNREHSWPRSYGFPDNDENLNYPFTDMHHLFLADGDYNFNRSNKPYEDCDAGCTEHVTETNDDRGGLGGGYPGDSNWTSGDFTQGRWEVWNHRKGDMARAMMYMDVRYEGGQHGATGANEPDLILTDDRGLIASANTGNNQFVAYMGILSNLLEWHTQDPVDPAEIRHHIKRHTISGIGAEAGYPALIRCAKDGVYTCIRHKGVKSEGDSKVRFVEGNYSDYEAERKQRLGEHATPKRIRYKKLKK